MKVDLKIIQIPYYGRLLDSKMNVYNLELVRKMRYETMLPINKTYFLFTVDILFYLTFIFHNADVCIFANFKTTAVFNYIFIRDKSIVFTVSMKFEIMT